MDRFNFVNQMASSFAPKKNAGMKESYINQLNAFSLGCPEKHLQAVYKYAHTLEEYPTVKRLFAYAKDKGLILDTDAKPEPQVWTCDHGGVGVPSAVRGRRCSKCGDKKE